MELADVSNPPFGAITILLLFLLLPEKLITAEYSSKESNVALFTVHPLVSPLNSYGPCATAEILRGIKIKENKDLHKDRTDCMKAYPF